MKLQRKKGIILTIELQQDFGLSKPTEVWL